MSINSWNCHSLDMKTVFLQGNQIDRDIFIKPPKEANVQGSMLKLNKVIYGLADTSCAWYLRVKDVLPELGLQMSAYDEALFCYNKNSQLQGIIIIHVNFLWGGTNEFGN